MSEQNTKSTKQGFPPYVETVNGKSGNVIIDIPNVSSIYNIKKGQERVHFSNSGNDANDGFTPEKPKRNLDVFLNGLTGKTLVSTTGRGLSVVCIEKMEIPNEINILGVNGEPLFIVGSMTDDEESRSVLQRRIWVTNCSAVALRRFTTADVLFQNTSFKVQLCNMKLLRASDHSDGYIEDSELKSTAGSTIYGETGSFLKMWRCNIDSASFGTYLTRASVAYFGSGSINSKYSHAYASESFYYSNIEGVKP